jgi:thiamine biosynthesis protein ThiS
MKETPDVRHVTPNSKQERGDGSDGLIAGLNMTISLNGEKVDARGAEDIAQLVERFHLSPETILIEHNGVALHRHEWPQRPLREGDQIELLRVVAGG